MVNLCRFSNEQIRDILLRASFLPERVENFPPLTASYRVDYDREWRDFKAEVLDVNACLSDVVDDYSKFVQSVPKEYFLSKKPEWLSFALSLCSENNHNQVHVHQIRELASTLPFGPILAPFLTYFSSQIKKSWPQLANDTAADLLIDAQEYLGSCLLKISGLTFYTELEKHKRLTELEGVQLYESFLGVFVENGWIDILIEYPLMVRLMHQRLEQFTDFFLELLMRFESDRSDLVEFSCSDDDDFRIHNVQFGLSDPHNSGKVVCKILLSNGERIIYKPKALDSEEWFFSQIHKTFPTQAECIGKIRILNKASYGWAWDVNPSRIPTDDKQHSVEAELGSVSAILYLMNASDFHYENLIKLGGKYYPVDLETLMNSHPDLDDRRQDNWRRFTVLSTGLFQNHFGKGSTNKDTSGFFSNESIPPFPIYTLAVSTKSGIRLEIGSPERSTDLLNSHNSCSSSNLDVERVKSTFRTTCAERNRKNLESAIRDGSENISRYVFRPTIFYYRIFQRLYLPKFFRDGAYFSLELAKLHLTGGGNKAKGWEKINDIINDEISQIQNGDIPYFFTQWWSKQLYSPNGKVCDEFFAESGLELAIQKLRGISESDIKEQMLLLNSSLMSCRYARDFTHLSRLNESQSDRQLTLERVLRFLDALCSQIVHGSYSHEEDHSGWVGFRGDLAGDNLYAVSNESSLYGGYWGILLFLASAETFFSTYGFDSRQLSSFLDSERSKLEAIGVEHYLERVKEKSQVLGIEGVGGIIFSWAAITNYCGNKWAFLKNWSDDCCAAITEDYINSDRHFDVISGASGLIFAMAFIHSSKAADLESPQTKSAKMVVKMSIDKLLSSYSAIGDMVYWDTLQDGNPLIGFAHGSMGVRAAIAKGINLLEQHSDYSYSNLAGDVLLAAKKFEDSKYSHIERNWCELRKEVPGGSHMNNSWCHGLAGAGISKLILKKYWPREECAESHLQIIAEQILARPDLQSNDCFCCGLSSEIEFLLSYSRMSGDRDLLSHVQGLLAAALTNFENHENKFRSFLGQTEPEVFPALFQGAAGLGYITMRALDTKIPSLSFSEF